MEPDPIFPQWDHEDPDGSLKRLYEWAVENARRQIGWYDRKRRPRRMISQCLLGLAVILGGIGILAPLIDAACQDCAIPVLDCSISFLQMGYISIALAGVVFLFDRTYGLSTAWMRFMETQMLLERSLNDFRFAWSRALSEPVPNDQVQEHQQKLLSMLQDFTKRVDDLIIGETKAWTVEFRQSLSEFDKLTKKP